MRAPQLSQPTTSLPRLPALDGVRALCISLIVVYHYLYGPLDAELRQGPVLYLHKAAALNWAAMDLFFVLSGFLIGRILICHRDSTNYFSTFYMRRALRIFPPYFLVLGLFYLLLGTPLASRYEWLFADPAPLWTYPLFLQNFWMTDGFGANWSGVTWSLALEEQFYLIFPLVVWFVPVRWLPPVLIAGSCLAPWLRDVLYGYGKYAGYALLPGRMDALMLGALIAWGTLYMNLQSIVERHRWSFLGAVAAAGILAIVARFVWNEGLGGPFIHTAFTLLSGALIIWAVVVSADTWGYKLFSSGVARWLANISFMLYLIHQPVLGLMHGALLDQAPRIRTGTDLAVTLLALLVALLLCSLSYRYFEKPILRIGAKLPYRTHQPSAGYA